MKSPKRRLDPAPRTGEDCDVWNFRASHNKGGVTMAFVSDRLDADLMFYAQQFKWADQLRVTFNSLPVDIRASVAVCHNTDGPEHFG
jgi:hypothetical protein